MTPQIKQRIVGIVVLLFLALIILPLIFGRGHSPLIEENTTSKLKLANQSDDEQQLSSTQTGVPIPDKIDDSVEHAIHKDISTSDASVIEEDKEEAAAPKINPEPTNSKVASSEQAINAKPQKEEFQSNKITSIQNNLIHTTTTKEVIEAPQLPVVISKKAILVAVSKPKVVKVTPSHTKKVVVRENEINWTIQLGSFSDSHNADTLVKKLKAKGYPVYTKLGKNTKGDEMTRVFVGPQTQRTTAQSVMSKLEKSFNVHGVIVKSGA